jgi:arsenate-mycothiol transferase
MSISGAGKPSVLFVCVKNGGKSQMAAGLMRKAADGNAIVDSAGTEPGAAVNGLAAQTMLEVGVDITEQVPKLLTEQLIQAADRVIVLGLDARVSPVDGTAIEVWDTDEPSTRGIEGIERMRLVRDDIARRVEELADEIR